MHRANLSQGAAGARSTYDVEHGTVKLNLVWTRQGLIIDDERDWFKTVRIEPRIDSYAYEMGSDPEGIAVAPAGSLQRLAQIMLVVHRVEEKLRERKADPDQTSGWKRKGGAAICNTPFTKPPTEPLTGSNAQPGPASEYVSRGPSRLQ